MITVIRGPKTAAKLLTFDELPAYASCRIIGAPDDAIYFVTRCLTRKMFGIREGVVFFSGDETSIRKDACFRLVDVTITVHDGEV